MVSRYAEIIAVLKVANTIFFEEDDDEKNIIPKVNNYAEKIVSRFSDEQFRQHFRISSSTFENLLMKLQTVQTTNNNVTNGRPEIATEKQLLITLWCLANLECFRSVADRFGVSKSSCWAILYRTCNRLLEINQRYKIIVWPSAERAEQIISDFEAINGFPGVIGVIDGSHIPILKPKEHPASYFCRKQFHSVLLQGVCDSKKLFLDVFAGIPGSVHDAKLYKFSDLSTRISTNSVIFPNNSHIIGDLAYPLSTKLLVGFKNSGNLTARQKNYNHKLSQIRVVIEHAFAYLKGRFRRLKMLETIRLDLIALLIVSACILHNICILDGDIPDDMVEQELLQDDADIIINPHNVVDNDAAIVKRNDIANALAVDLRYS